MCERCSSGASGRSTCPRYLMKRPLPMNLVSGSWLAPWQRNASLTGIWLPGPSPIHFLVLDVGRIWSCWGWGWRGCFLGRWLFKRFGNAYHPIPDPLSLPIIIWQNIAQKKLWSKAFTDQYRLISYRLLRRGSMAFVTNVATPILRPAAMVSRAEMLLTCTVFALITFFPFFILSGYVLCRLRIQSTLCPSLFIWTVP